MTAASRHNREPKRFGGNRDSANWIERDLEAAEFERLYRESFDVVYARVLFKMRDEEAARDVTAEAYMRAARYFDRFDPSKSKFATWVNSIASNCAADYYRKNKQHQPLEDASAHLLAFDEKHADRMANSDLVNRLLMELSEEDREIICMKFIEGLSNNEIAEIMQMNPSTVSTRIQRALNKMRDALDEEA